MFEFIDENMKDTKLFLNYQNAMELFSVLAFDTFFSKTSSFLKLLQ